MKTTEEQINEEAHIKCYLFRRWMRRETPDPDGMPEWMLQHRADMEAYCKEHPVDDWGNPL